MKLPEFIRKLFKLPDPSLASFIELKYGWPSNPNTIDNSYDWVRKLPESVVFSIYEKLYVKQMVATYQPHYEMMAVLIAMHASSPEGKKIIRQKLMEYHS